MNSNGNSFAFLNITLATACMAAKAFGATSDVGGWERVHPPVGVENRQRIAFGNGRFVALAGNVIQTSSNGIAWMSTHTNNQTLADLAFANGQFVAVGRAGTILSSMDGLTWTRGSSGIVQDLGAVTFGGSRFLTVGRCGAMLTSATGDYWVNATQLPWQVACSSQDWHLDSPSHLVFGAGRFVAVYQSYSFVLGAEGSEVELRTSDDGTGWFQSWPKHRGAINGLAFGNGLFVAVIGSSTLTSADGLAWQPGPLLPISNVAGIDFVSEKFVAFGSSGVAGELATSPDGVTWTRREQGDWSRMQSAAAGDGRIVAVGESVLLSTNGIDWHSAYPTFRRTTLLGVAASESLIVAVGLNGAILTSLDGISWSERETPTTDTLTDVALGEGRYVVVGANYSDGTGIILSSSDGVRWDQVGPPGLKGLTAVVHGLGNFVALDRSGAVLVSTGGVDWGPAEFVGSMPIPIGGVAYGNGHFVGVGSQGDVVVSTNGRQWSVVELNSGDILYRVIFGRGEFLAIGSGNRVFTSQDGRLWDSHPLESVLEFGKLTFGGGLFLSTVSGASLVASRDGIRWEAIEPTLIGGVNAVTFGGGRIYAVGGGIERSAELPSRLELARLAGTPHVQIDLFGHAGKRLRVESSSNLAEWFSLKSVVAGADGVTVEVSDTTSSAHRFYRTVPE